MHEKYVFLHCSYSVPTRVSDITNVYPVSEAARDIVGAEFLLMDLFVFRTAVPLFCVERDVVVRTAERVLFVRGIRVVERGVLVLFVVVDTRLWDCCADVLADFVRETLVPSRTAPPAIPVQSNKFMTKIRIFFISGKKSSKILLFSASE